MDLSLKIIEESLEDSFQISAAGDLIITNANQLQTKIDNAIHNGITRLLLDLTNIQYIDSFGIGVIVKTKTEIDKKKGSLTVFVKPELKTLFQKCHLDDYINLEVSQ
jgi:anti-anti-sigma factor